MKQIIEELVKTQLYNEFSKEHYVKGMNYAAYVQYIRNMIKYVEDNHRQRCEELLKKHG